MQKKQRKAYIEAVVAQYQDFELHYVPLEAIFDERLIVDTDNQEILAPASQSLTTLFDNVTSLTSKEDLLSQLTQQLLSQIAFSTQ
jgi:hypothetical protein